MITGFEKQTEPLTLEEKRAVLFLIPVLRSCAGKENAMNSGKLLDLLRSNGMPMEGSRLRKVINYIRINKLVKNLIANSQGYFVENDREKVRQYVRSLHERAEAIMAVANSYSDLL